MKLKMFLTVLFITIAGFIVYSQMNQKPFAPAEDFPGNALLYVQIADLPAVIKLWNESAFKEKYLASDNYKNFANNHLGRKLASRWQEFNDAAGFSIDLETLGKLTGNRASIALYDVGKLEFVFIAPVSDEIFAATKFSQNRDKFTEETLADGTTIYRISVEADRGRQKQELIFTHLNGRFVIATSEKLLTRTIDNISGKQTKNRLIDETSFAVLSEKIQPHSATVWLDQKALNDDYYFKRYWLMSDVEDLKNMRAGILDFEMQEGKLIERRKFLLDQNTETSPVANSDAEEMSAFLPSGIPFYRLQTANKDSVNKAVEQTIFARPRSSNKKSGNSYSGFSSFDDYNDYSNSDYQSLGEKYDEAIDETDDEETIEKRDVEIDFSKILQTAKPQAILTFTDPKILPAPMFVDFQRGAVIHLASTKSFVRENFEAAIMQKLAAKILIIAPDVKLTWETKTENSIIWRGLKLPMLDWSVNYALIGHELIISSDEDFLLQILSAPRIAQIEKQDLPLTSLSVINFNERETAYDKIFYELKRNKQAEVFFTNNIGSLLDAVSQIKQIEIKESYEQNIFNEEITLSF